MAASKPRPVRRSKPLDFRTVLQSSNARRNEFASQLSKVLKEAEAVEEVTTLVKRALPRNCQSHCLCAGVTGKKLIIVVDASVWASKIRLEQRRLLQELSQLSVFVNVESIQTRVRPASRALTAEKSSPTPHVATPEE